MNATLRDLLDAHARLSAAGEDLVVATILATEGSTYRKAGARMLFTRGGGWVGMLGGGSFEEDLAALAAPLFADGGPREVECDMPSRRDASAGATWERDGSARILLQRAGPDNGYAPLSLIARMVSERRAGVLATVCRSADARVAAGTCFVAGDAAGGLPPEVAEEAAATAASVAEQGEPMLVEHLLPEGEVEIFYAPVKLPVSLLILGAGPDAMPLVRIAGVLGWQVTVVDPRGARPAMPEMEILRCGSDDLESAVPLHRIDAAVFMFRSFEMDRQYLPVLARSPVPYIGILGSKRRRESLVQGLDASAAARLEGRLHGPAGLDLGADTPEEIALEIAAQVQSLHARRAREARERAAAREAAMAGVHAVILAAGGSRRYGAFKQLLEYQGESLLRRATRAAMSLLGERVNVVHGPKPTKCQRELASFTVRHVVNERWESGMASSLRAGISALPGDCRAALVMLCDQPLVGSAQLGRLLAAWAEDPDRIVAAAYGETLGVPAIFPRRFFPELLELRGDRGARAVIEAHRAEVTAVPLPEAALDIDTQDDYAALLTGRAPAGPEAETTSRESS